ncbi:MAG TPA: acetylglutamate kinase [Candidatus Baltobacteraceae bacterium]|nr:acetylglutamate kinase [Candidatus Baltobacteraceae bacterium]
MPHKIARPVVVKAGGNALDSAAERSLAAQVQRLAASGRQVVVVHGGGPEIDAELNRLNIVSSRIDGLRTTSAAALVATERVLCGSVNKRLVRALLQAGVPAVGISGTDGAMLAALPVDADRYGFVGRIESVNAAPLHALLQAGFVPVVAPLGYHAAGGTALNVNADTSAAAIAGALGASEFLLLTNVTRVRREPSDPASGIDGLTLADARAFLDTPACEGSMRPKIQAAVDAVAAGVERAYIGAAPLEQLLGGDATIVSA